ncbi:type III secretion system cytoplasmic ring protein SctQ [Dickeya zeae]|uniref:type III secretion system cytoplasmic ring protein SctQ n=1 Tax=Dickeya zeae TaxID=204042 RepID=UPI000C9B26D9|nr:type III secretion system cytoplasmic ring protein SctQ [Dickeya zeae]AUQ25694.1 YscQ/HrcQ family type III secretion apparatus protein [Dickeya zeae]UJR58766.1 type III secretion system cytoplasmic ring protein SctQ [Dickeya zeae]
MIPLAQTLRHISQAQAALSRQLASAQRFAFTLEGQPGELRMQLADDAPAVGAESGWRCHDGSLWLDNAAPLLSLLSACPALLPGKHDSNETVTRYWTHYNQALSPALRELFGEIQPLLPAQPDSVAASDNNTHSGDNTSAELTLWLEVIRGDFRIRSRLRTSFHTVQRWQSRPGWHAPRSVLPNHLAIRLPLILADVTLSQEQLASLEPGDVICPHRQYFSPQGDGSITLADRRLAGQLRMEALAPYWFAVTELEDCPVTTFTGDTTPFGDPTPFDDTASYGNTPPDNSNVQETSPCAESTLPSGEPLSGYPLPPLALALTVRCGYLTLTLQDLQQLAPGTVLPLQQATPGEATLYHGEQPLAQGELVNVEGRLGLQITRGPVAGREIAMESLR